MKFYTVSEVADILKVTQGTVYYKEIKKLMTDLNRVYADPTEETALNELEQLRDKWYPEYPKNYKSWHNHQCHRRI